MDTEDNKWHWGEGNKYALEAMKTLLLLNGGSAVALLAFVGNLKGSNATLGATATLPPIGSAMFCFGFGALCAALAFIFAYLTQLEYGNKGVSGARNIFHHMTYVPVLLSALAFVAGLLFGWRNLPI